jgi:hypothetical protein
MFKNRHKNGNLLYKGTSVSVSDLECENRFAS